MDVSPVSKVKSLQNIFLKNYFIQLYFSLIRGSERVRGLVRSQAARSRAPTLWALGASSANCRPPGDFFT